ncbi:MAG: 2-C-methyl-D-erythritol 2,4-cyclodiphosphate synthase, partial [Ruminiclostridium sp.]|nr:2-C-methyl-D-erythritol 2,4-cyclodiphosphate synthase [Ruminiclostridium sp.]
KGISSMLLLERANELIKEKGARLSNADITIVAEKPKLMRYIEVMRESVAKVLGVSPLDIGIKATTEEGLGIAGQGIAAHAVVLMENE